MNIKQTLFALAIGSMGITCTTSTLAANTFNFVGGGLYPGEYIAPTGSWSRFLTADSDEDLIPDLYSYTPFRAAGGTGIPGPNGTLNFDVENTLTLGTLGTPGVGGFEHHSGNMIDRDQQSLFATWAAHSTTGALEITWDGISNTATVNMSDWRWNWSGATYNMGAGGSALLNNQDGIWGNGDDTLDYTTIMTDPTFAGVEYGLHLVGSASLTPVPEASTYGMMLAGLGLVGFAVRRRK
jgi:hypothetical protein